MSNTPQYKMTANLSILEHLGTNLYSNFAAVITEVVANAWDADAERVEIDIDEIEMSITIQDDGIGMNFDDINEKYLTVGYRRRENPHYGSYTKKGRKVMGRKGLGKLSLFSIANEVEVHTVKEDDVNGFVMSIGGIKNAVDEKKENYTPDPISREEIQIEQGTKITLREIRRQRLSKGVKALKKTLARRFSVIGDDFQVFINGEPITSEDRGDLQVVQFLWFFGPDDYNELPQLLEKKQLPDREDGWTNDWRISGWVGTAKKPKQLDCGDAGNLNSIVIHARGRLFHENVLDKLNDGRIYTKYLTGQIKADFLDEDDHPDIATSDRQRIQEDDPRFEALLSFLRGVLRVIHREWNGLRQNYEVERVVQELPILDNWLSGLPEGYRRSAKKMIANISALPLEKVEDEKLMLKHGIIAFERMKMRGFNEDLANNLQNIEELLKLLADRDSLEASLYCEIIKSRLGVIEKFKSIVDENAKEKVLQEYLFKNLWLLDPAWERATENVEMESRLIGEGVIVDDLTEKEKLGRVDIAYRSYTGKHIIIELKRVNRKMKLIELFEQGNKYVDKLKKIARYSGEDNPDIEVYFILGKPLDEESSNPDRLKNTLSGISKGSKIIHYNVLIDHAVEAYSEYLDSKRNLDRLQGIIDAL